MSAASQSINTILSETVERLNKRSTPDEIEAAVREAAAAFD